MKLIAILVLTFFLISCGHVDIKVKPIWKPEIKKVDGVVSPSLKKLLKSKTSPKVVLRVPNIVSSITQSDTTSNTDYTTFYGQFEMELVKQGFVLRDRALLQSLMSSGMTNYAAIGKKIDTDLIIEITNIKLNDEWQKANTFLDQNNTTYQSYNSVQNQVFTMDLRIIEIKTGEVGSILKLKTSIFELINSEFMYYRGQEYIPWDYNDPTHVHYIIEPTRGYSFDKIIPLLAEKLSKMINDRLRGDI